MAAPKQYISSRSRVIGPALPFPGAHPSGKTLHATPLRGAAKTLLVPLLGLDFFGSGVIKGTVKVITTPAPARLVRLYHRESGKLLRETWSEGSGAYSFSNMKPGRSYYVIAFDNVPGYDPTISPVVAL